MKYIISLHDYVLKTALISVHMYILTGISLFSDVAYRSTHTNLASKLSIRKSDDQK